jgi:hypothetical protein
METIMTPHPTCQRTFSVIEYLHSKGKDSSTEALLKILPYREKDILAYILKLVHDGCIEMDDNRMWYPSKQVGETDES